MGRVTALALILVACGGSTPRAKEKYPGDTEEEVALEKPKKATPKSNPVPSPIASPKGSEVGNTPVPESEPTTPPPSGEESRGIGASCNAAAGCNGDANVCFTDGYPGGMCSKACSRLCPGNPTFCIPDRSASGGVCVSTCSSDSDCREDYECVTRPRFNEHSVTKNVCIPKNEEERDCVSEFKALVGSGAQTWMLANESTRICEQEFTCSINAPLLISNVMNGIAITEEGTNSSQMLGVSCRMAHALYRMTASLRKLEYSTSARPQTHKVTEVRFSRLFACEHTSGVRFPAVDPHALGDVINTAGIFHGKGESIDISSIVIDDIDATVYDFLGTYDYRHSEGVRAPLITVLDQLKDDHIFNNVYTPYCNDTFGSTLYGGIKSYVHADIAVNSGAEWMNPSYGRDDPTSAPCKPVDPQLACAE